MTELPAPPTRATPVASPVALARPSPLLIAGVVAVGGNLRPVVTSIGPLVHQIRDGLHLSGATAGLLLTIPTLCFGAVAPLAPLLHRRLGIATSVLLILVAVTAGLALRVTGGEAALFAGTTLAAAGAACGNVLLPVIVRRSFAQRIGTISALYTTAIVGMAALSAGVTVPIAHALGHGWRGGLAVWTAPALLGLLLWAPQLARDRGRPLAVAGHARMRDVTHSSITWQLTLFFGLQSWGFTTMLAWMPSIFESHGLSNTDAGFLLGLAMTMAVPAALLLPRLAARGRDQRRLAVWLAAMIAVGYTGLLAAPASAPVLWAILIGTGQGGCFPLALTLIVLRGGATDTTASLSTHVQSVGYLLGAAGPLVGGVLHDATGSWTLTLAVLMALLVPLALSGAGAGRARTLARYG